MRRVGSVDRHGTIYRQLASDLRADRSVGLSVQRVYRTTVAAVYRAHSAPIAHANYQSAITEAVKAIRIVE